MTDHPCKGLPQEAVEAFEQIAINGEPIMRVRTKNALLRRGLIEVAGEREVGRDRFGAIKIPVYGVPLPVHYQWCRWAGEQPWPEGFEENGETP